MCTCLQRKRWEKPSYLWDYWPVRYFWGVSTTQTARMPRPASATGVTVPILQVSLNLNILPPSDQSEESIYLGVSKLVALMWHVMSMVGHPLTFYSAFIYFPLKNITIFLQALGRYQLSWSLWKEGTLGAIFKHLLDNLHSWRWTSLISPQAPRIGVGMFMATGWYFWPIYVGARMKT